MFLREKEKLIQRDAFDGIDYTGGNITILKQVEKYISIKNGNAKSTEQNYMTALALLKKDPIGAVRIKDVKQSDAKIWFVELQNIGRKYGTIENLLY